MAQLPKTGQGVFAKACFRKGDFVVEYRGDLINWVEVKRRRMTYRKACVVFLFEFYWKENTWCIDAAVEDGSLGRLVNGNHAHPNCKMRTVMAKGKPHLCLFALRDIHPGEEITYDHQPRNKRNLDEAKVGIIPHLDDTPNSNQSQGPYTRSSRLNGTRQKTKYQMESDSDEPLDGSSDSSSDEYIPEKRGQSSSSRDTNASAIRVSVDPKPKRRRIPNVGHQPRERVHASLKRGGSPMRTKSPSGQKRPKRCSSRESCPTSAGKATKPSQGGDTEALSEEKKGSNGGSVDVPSVPAVCKKEDGSRMYNKKHYCFYCKVGIGKLARHLARVHKHEPEVDRALSFPVGSTDRSMCFERLRNQGNFAHNMEVLKSGVGSPVPCHLPKDSAQAHHFTHCAYCHGFLLKKALNRHLAVCKFKPEGTSVDARSGFTATQLPGLEEPFGKLVNSMNQDAASDAVKSDPWIMEYGEYLYGRLGRDVDQHEYIRQQMRRLGRLLVCSRKNSPVQTIQDLIRPSNFTHAVQAAKDAVGYDCRTGTYKSPSLALNIGRNLDKISKLVSESRKGDGVVEDARAFHVMYKKSWHRLLSAEALTSESEWNAPRLLDFTRDAQTLHSYLDARQKHLVAQLSAKSSCATYTELTKVLFAKVVLFNRARALEVSKIPLSAYLSCKRSDPKKDVNVALSRLEKTFSQHFWRIYFTRKADTKVPILLTSPMRQAMDLLVRKRQECGIAPENTYLFAKSSSLIRYHVSGTLRKLATVCGAKSPASLASKKLSQHMAAVSQVLNLAHAELAQLGHFLRLDISLQHEFYRLPQGTLQLAKICKVLVALENGQQVRGKSLDDIHIDPEENVHVDSHQHRGPERPSDKVAARGSLQSPSTSEESDPTKHSGTLPQSKNPHKPLGVKKRQYRGRRKWDKDEVAAVERHLMSFITSRQLPGKRDCTKCLNMEKAPLANRNWLSIKFYVNNRITACKKKV